MQPEPHDNSPPAGRDLVELGNRIRSAREAAGLSIQRLADRVGVHRTTVMRIETGDFTRPNYATLRRLSDALELDEADLLALAGYTAADQLPTLPAYLRAKYRMPPEAAAELTNYFSYLIERYGIEQDGHDEEAA